MEFKLVYEKISKRINMLKDFLLKKSLKTRIMTQFFLVIVLIVDFF